MSLPPGELKAFAQQLGSLMSVGGRSLDDCLLMAAAQHQGSRELKDVVLELRRASWGGYPLSTCMSQYPDFFDASFVEVVREGEQTGTLEDALVKYGAGGGI